MDELGEILGQIDYVVQSRPAQLRDGAIKALRLVLNDLQKHVTETTVAPYSPPEKFGIDEFE
jgi:hypothetical protein